jgi:hypothetical protein
MFILMIAGTANSENTVIPNHILNTYSEFRRSISDADLGKFKELYYLTPDLVYPTESDFIESKNDLLFLYPDLKTVNILEFRINNECAGIVYRDDDEHYVNLNIIKFKKAERHWEVYSAISGTSFDHAKTEEESEALIRDALENSDALKVNC